MVLPAFFDSAREVMQIFDRFGAVSGMKLNLPKSVVVPLWLAPPEQTKADIASSLPEWTGVEVTNASRYLGYMVGPGKGSKS